VKDWWNKRLMTEAGDTDGGGGGDKGDKGDKGGSENMVPQSRLNKIIEKHGAEKAELTAKVTDLTKQVETLMEADAARRGDTQELLTRTKGELQTANAELERLRKVEESVNKERSKRWKALAEKHKDDPKFKGAMDKGVFRDGEEVADIEFNLDTFERLSEAGLFADDGEEAPSGSAGRSRPGRPDTTNGETSRDKFERRLRKQYEGKA